MRELRFQVTSMTAVPFAAVPLVSCALEVLNPDAAVHVHSGLIRCQIQIETMRREYDAEEQARLLDLFGEPERWSTTLKSMLWTHVTVTLPAFSERVTVDVPVPCSFDFNLAATKYFDGLRAGDIPLDFLFSGTVFYEVVSDTVTDASNPDGESPHRLLQVTPISWDSEARYRLPVQVWRDLMDHYYPNGAWLRLRRDTFDRLSDYKRRHAIPTWEEMFDRILLATRQAVRS
jgi:hypothetical protein